MVQMEKQFLKDIDVIADLAVVGKIMEVVVQSHSSPFCLNKAIALLRK